MKFDGMHTEEGKIGERKRERETHRESKQTDRKQRDEGNRQREIRDEKIKERDRPKKGID